jgi:hypothetical protein
MRMMNFFLPQIYADDADRSYPCHPRKSAAKLDPMVSVAMAFAVRRQ